jgi:hypothetical protein
VKITFAPCRRRNVSVIVRRCLLPLVPIQDRDVCRLDTADRPAGPATVPGTPTAPPATAPNGDEDDVLPPVLDGDPPRPAGPAPVPPPTGEAPTRTDEAVPAGDVAPETETCGVVTLGTDALVVAIGVVTCGVDTDGVVTVGTVTGGGDGGGGGGGSGGGDGVVTVGVVTVVTAGTGTVTLGTVTDGTVGVGTRSASAWSAS